MLSLPKSEQGGRWTLAAAEMAIFGVVGLGLLRRVAELIEDLDASGDVLRSHDGSLFSLNDFGQDLGRLEFLVLAGGLAWVATRARGVFFAAAAAFAGVFADSITR